MRLYSLQRIEQIEAEQEVLRTALKRNLDRRELCARAKREKAEAEKRCLIEQLMPEWEVCEESQGQDTEIALAAAIRILNRLAKSRDVDRDDRSDIYHAKDRWIRSRQCYLVSGRVERVERNWDYGTEKTLYLHQFDIQGFTFSLHSYSEPERLTDEPGVDLPQYGLPMTKKEAEATLGMSWKRALFLINTIFLS